MLEYTIQLNIRIYDVNYGGHLGHVELVNMMHEARIHFLKSVGLNEGDDKGNFILMRDLSLRYKNQGYWNDTLEFNIKISTEGVRIIFDYQINNLTKNNECATAQAIMVYINKDLKPLRSNLLMDVINNNVRTKQS